MRVYWNDEYETLESVVDGVIEVFRDNDDAIRFAGKRGLEIQFEEST